jgi:hypothetical protein
MMDGDKSMVTLNGRSCGFARRMSWLTALGVAAVLIGCDSAPAPIAQTVPAMTNVPAAPIDAQETASTTPIAQDAKASPFELMGTSINAANTFAILEESGHRLFTVHEGDKIDGYTIAGIEADRVRVLSPDNDEQLLVSSGKPAVVPSGSKATVAAVTTSPSRLITENLNTDQSIPTNVTYGPTGFDPNNGMQMGH